MALQPVLIDGQWRAAAATGTFRADNPATREQLADEYPVSAWADCDAALSAAVGAHEALRTTTPETIARFLERFAERIEARAGAIVDMAHLETAYPKSPRLADVELPRTTNQLRQAAVATRDGSWQRVTIDRKANIRSRHASIGPVCVFGPNNFPLAFGSASGGDFVAAIAAGNPVIAKANSSHPGTTRLFAEEAQAAVAEVSLPAATVQLLYRTSHADGERLVADPRVGATGYTGSRAAGLTLKAAADKAGKPIYLELSSVNPVVILPGALAERREQLVGEFMTSCLMGTGQFCTNPGLIILLDGGESQAFIADVAKKFTAAPVGTLLSSGVGKSLSAGIEKLRAAGAEVLAGGDAAAAGSGAGYCCANTLLRTTAAKFVADAETWQTELFGNASLIVVASNANEAAAVLDHLEGNLTGCIYSDTRGGDDGLYDQLAPRLRPHVGRLLNDKMPTGVAVSPAMNHGGPFPATGHSGFTAVGMPASLWRFTALECYDNVREHRLPAAMRDKNPSAATWRSIDGQWTQSDA
ncbi:MAG: aldehyde dehydrogenase (NADP(+)) [Pirellulales bacterium]